MRDRDRIHFWRWLDERAEQPLVFGQFDCCTLAADYLRDLHGRVDAMSGYRGSYNDVDGAKAIITAGGGMRALVEDFLGPIQSPSLLQCGWIVLGRFGDGEALGLCTGHNVAVPTERRLGYFPLGRAIGGWSPYGGRQE